jgi:hypothetical protein
MAFYYTIDTNQHTHIKSFELYKSKDKIEITIIAQAYNIKNNNIKLVYCMDNDRDCKDFGWYYTTLLTNSELDNGNSINPIDYLPLEIDNYIGKEIDTINIFKIPSVKSEYGGSIVMEINLENNNKCHFVMYNFHNGKCPHNIVLNVYENNESNPIRVLKTNL